jgi:hypothetical protein
LRQDRNPSKEKKRKKKLGNSIANHWSEDIVLENNEKVTFPDFLK